MNSNIETEIANGINLKSSLTQDYKMLALHAHQQIHHQLRLNPFKDAVVAYQILNSNRVILIQVNHFMDKWNNRSVWKLSMITGKMNLSGSESHNESVESILFKQLEHIDKIHRLARIDARQPVDNVDELTKELFLELTEKFVRNFYS